MEAFIGFRCIYYTLFLLVVSALVRADTNQGRVYSPEIGPISINAG